LGCANETEEKETVKKMSKAIPGKVRTCKNLFISVDSLVQQDDGQLLKISENHKLKQ
jgi:hypothetical protein